MNALKVFLVNIIKIIFFYYLVQFSDFLFGAIHLINAILSDVVFRGTHEFFYIITFYSLCFLFSFLVYFIAKKLGLIKIIDNLSFFKALLFIIFVEIILTLSFPINFSDLPFFEFVIKEHKRIIINTLIEVKIGFGWIYPIIAYKTIKLLTTKYPNKFNWILKLYPKKLDEIITFNNFKKIIYKLIINPTKKAIKWLKDNYRPY